MGLKNEEDSDHEGVKMSEEDGDGEGGKYSLSSPSADQKNGDCLKRKRSSHNDVDITGEAELTRSPLKKPNLDSPPPPPPPPAPPMETPPEGEPHDREQASALEAILHADTSFKSKSMADVLAEAQQDLDDDLDVSMQDARTTFEHDLDANGGLQSGAMLDNPLTDAQVTTEVKT